MRNTKKKDKVLKDYFQLIEKNKTLILDENKKDIKKYLLLILKSLNNNYIKISFEKNLFFEGFDSLDYLNLIFKIQNKYKIKINNKELNQLKKLDEIIVLILKKVKK